MIGIAVLHILYVVAITAESMTAALSAGRRNMDWVGVCLLGWVTALGGGSLRDVLLGHYPLVWVKTPIYLVIAVAAAAVTIAIARVMHRLNTVFLTLDAIGLVVFTILGCNVALQMDLPAVIVVAVGMITGCFGGVLRDVLCNDIPLLFRSELYASASILAGSIYVIGLNLALPHDLVMAVAMISGLALRLLSIRYNWHMPRFVYTWELHESAVSSDSR